MTLALLFRRPRTVPELAFQPRSKQEVDILDRAMVAILVARVRNKQETETMHLSH